MHITKYDFAKIAGSVKNSMLLGADREGDAAGNKDLISDICADEKIEVCVYNMIKNLLGNSSPSEYVGWEKLDYSQIIINEYILISEALKDQDAKDYLEWTKKKERMGFYYDLVIGQLDKECEHITNAINELEGIIKSMPDEKDEKQKRFVKSKEEDIEYLKKILLEKQELKKSVPEKPINIIVK